MQSLAALRLSFSNHLKLTIMEFKALLTSRKYHVDGTWYAPQEFISKFKSVVRCDYINMTSSAGDWSGYILQKLNGLYHLILFWQTNSYPDRGFDVVTNNVASFSFESEEIPTAQDCEEYLWMIYNF